MSAAAKGSGGGEDSEGRGLPGGRALVPGWGAGEGGGVQFWREQRARGPVTLD